MKAVAQFLAIGGFRNRRGLKGYAKHPTIFATLRSAAKIHRLVCKSKIRENFCATGSLAEKMKIRLKWDWRRRLPDSAILKRSTDR